MDQQGKPNEPQLVYRRHPETGQPVEGHLRWNLIPLFREKRPDFAPIHARAETVAENEWFGDAYRKRRCVVPMNSFFRKNDSGKRHAISRRDGDPFEAASMAVDLVVAGASTAAVVASIGALVSKALV